MPNHITNRVEAPAEVLRSMINTDGVVDFNRLLPFKGAFPWDAISAAAETAAEAISGEPLNEHPLINSLQVSNRQRANVMDLNDEEFEQFVQMLRNKRICGHMHDMNWGRAAWGTKWNAYSQVIELDEGRLSFETAWSCPAPVFKELSRLHPDAVIQVQFADEDIGSNCGTITFVGGEIAKADCAGRWDSMSTEEQAKWTAFAYSVKGWAPEED